MFPANNAGAGVENQAREEPGQEEVQEGVGQEEEEIQPERGQDVMQAGEDGEEVEYDDVHFEEDSDGSDVSNDSASFTCLPRSPLTHLQRHIVIMILKFPLTYPLDCCCGTLHNASSTSLAQRSSGIFPVSLTQKYQVNSAVKVMTKMTPKPQRILVILTLAYRFVCTKTLLVLISSSGQKT
jgi:hypothetical protein